MPGYIIHIAIAKEYIRKHKEKDENIKEFIDGTIQLDLIKPKSESHYGKSPAYTNLKKYLENNKIDNSFKKGEFLHLIADYLFYNFYLDKIDKEIIHNDYDILNNDLIKKYEINYIPNRVKNNIFFKEGKTKILDKNLILKVIDEISSLNIYEVEKEVMENNKKWNNYKNLI